MKNENLAQIETEIIEKDPSIKFLKKIEEFQNELKILKQNIKELNNNDSEKKLLEFDTEDLENKIKEYSTSLKKYLSNGKINGLKDVEKVINFKKTKINKDKLETNITDNTDDVIKNKIREEIQEFQKRKAQ